MPRSRSWSIESITRSVTSSRSCAEKTPDWRSIASTSVVLPWSTCAMIATLRMSLRVAMRGPLSVRGPRLGLEHDLHRAVRLLLERLVRLGRVVERQPVGGEALDAERILVGQERHDLRHPALDVRLAHPQLDLLAEDRQHRQRVRLAAVDAAQRDRAAAPHDVDRR